MKVKRIVIIGPESTGKSTLCSELAAHYQTSWVPEFARDYLLTHGKDYTLEDLSVIADGQLKSEDAFADKIESTYKSRAARGNAPLLFIDTDMYVMKTWSEFVFEACDNRILRDIVNRQYDLYLLCDTDLPWQADALREYPDLDTREKLFEHYREAMINQPVDWAIIRGGYEERLQMAIEAVDTIVNKTVL
jgi:NadR type nicotinamide-nucleotide adenylyltransferase